MCNVILVVGSRFSDQAHHNEFVESGSGSWALIRGRLVLRREKRTGSDGPRSQGEGTPRLRTRIPNSSRIPGTPPYTCRSSMSILEYTSHRPLFLALYELLWPPSYCPGVTSTSMGLGC